MLDPLEVDSNSSDDEGTTPKKRGFTVVKEQYSIQEANIKSGKTRITKAMEETLGKNKAKFTHKTLGVLAMYICCRFARSRDDLRSSYNTR